MRINLEEFAEIYICEAFKIARKNPELDYFDEQLRRNVSKKTNLTPEQVKYIHHAFHWMLLCDNDSILEYVQPTNNGENNFVRLKRPYTTSDIKKITKSVLDKYGDYLKARVMTIPKAS